MYRLLDARRFSGGDSLRLPEITVLFSDWADLCKLAVTRPDKVRRTLDPAHDELLKNGYLTKVAYDGKGVRQHIRYVFGTVEPEREGETPGDGRRLVQRSVWLVGKNGAVYTQQIGPQKS